MCASISKSQQQGRYSYRRSLVQDAEWTLLNLNASLNKPAVVCVFFYLPSDLYPVIHLIKPIFLLLVWFIYHFITVQLI